ncbi:hybrid sensory histidine kinase BarA [Rosistilla carotiformis]|uniref:Hybrid sensory histidine kinase BarA n=1 Tax=Rosistilla carotiformis TaxID=2528017 RepID=A0A518JVA9_9BACT|nr:Hpt domain-containing protein [Rosistilla carotiformis]QDV69475.1 hybrid sensory histidine kinase BarA [Rosistilla carotiformis]
MNEEHSLRFANALKRLSGDAELLTAMASIVSDDAPEIVTELETQLQAGDTTAIVAAAHKLKGMCSTFEEGHPVSLLEDVIHSARGGAVDEARITYSRCAPEIHELLQEIANLRDG